MKKNSAASRNNTQIVKRDSKGRIRKAEIKDPSRPAVSRRNERKTWSNDDVKEIKLLAKENTPTRVMGLKLGRSEASIRAKARTEGISLKPVNRSPNKGRTSRPATGKARARA